MELFHPGPSTTILDLGGSDGSYFLSLYPWPEQIIALDLDLVALRSVVNGQPIWGNGLHLLFRDSAFDVVWSNTVIEHVGRFSAQRMFAKEIRRCLSKYFAVGWYSKGEWGGINLLWQFQLQKLFPGANTLKHRVTLWAETLIAYKKP